MKNVFLNLVLILIIPISLWAQEPIAIPSFHAMSLYWSPSGGVQGKKVVVSYRETGATQWLATQDMIYNPRHSTEVGKYRSSVVNLKPNTDYDFRLTLQGGVTKQLKKRTWTEKFPIKKTIKIGNRTSTLNASESGDKNGYVLYEAENPGQTVINVGNNAKSGISVTGEYVIIRGFIVKGAQRDGILVQSNHVVVENNDVSGFGRRGADGFALNWDSGIKQVRGKGNIIIQRNKIHHPRYDANSWLEPRPNYTSNNHPLGATGINLFESSGKNVIRYNEIYSDNAHYFNDGIGGGQNDSWVGNVGSDSDIYGNKISHCHDDALEIEGGNRNVRIWNNYMKQCFIGVGTAPVSIGPMYVFRNVAEKLEITVNGTGGRFWKGGTAGNQSYMGGLIYIFHNTIFNNKAGIDGLGNKPMKNITSRNNILAVRSSGNNSISANDGNNSYNYDLYNGKIPNGTEANGIKGNATYENGAGFNSQNNTGNFKLSTSSLGFDAGIKIANFNDSFNGKAPDMGAHENNTSNFSYGVNANFLPDSSPTDPVDPIEDITSRNWHLENKATDQWVRPLDCASDIGTPLVVTPKGNTGNCSMFTFEETDTGYYFIINKATEGRLKFFRDSNNGNDTVPVELVSDAYTGWNPQWKLIDAGDGYYRIQNRVTGNWIRSQGCSGDENTLITQVSTGFSGDCTKWRLVDAGVRNKSIEHSKSLGNTVFLYPNPVNKQLFLESHNSLKNIEFIKIYDVQGRITKDISNSELKLNTLRSIDVSGIKNGMYILSIGFIKGETENSQFVIKH
ncbi:T9SS type A sorting domain-containing protein [uncultured Aquimarina sp.]|uniref:T9SS type A sorting domain-containing protein n=1 Tax=uncultured Aquimarina sp. TaxID=575652 RepID=UPI00263466CA|nr:T9SS type A sorting domain-containing protein [uncultured Aquimarina sp.]